MPGLFWIVPIATVLTIAFALYLVKNVMRRPTGTPKMKEIGDILTEEILFGSLTKGGKVKIGRKNNKTVFTYL